MINKNLPYIIDTDGGADDSFAIMVAYANAPSYLSLILASYGNYTLDTVTQNISALSSFTKINAPILRGSEKAMGKSFTDSNPTAKTFFQESNVFKEGSTPIDCDDFAKYVYDLARKNKKINYISIGPMTNLATILTKYPDITEYIDSVILMGGGIDCQHIGGCAEYNVYCDPVSSNKVFASSLPIYMADLGLCQKSILTREQKEAITESAGRNKEEIFNLFEIDRRYSEGYGNPPGIIYDACATVYMFYPEIFKTEQIGVDVLLSDEFYGKTVKTNNRNNVTRLLDVDRDEFAKVLQRAVEFYR